ncbi:hypothetical protein DTO164E3_6896 [Paecilomyces variotii]|uniref:Uncharacterized protein n=1 Tax=Byssochlamys spectabilis TaxID=264951 RepID=A0A443HQS6_BYSSP|nr:hypothetical protein C8Q69DRAFT_472853 [Paecilomyces variotii]KAJ9191511.1 hypothetical protein DTO032I3_8804 [Paecilomyces variotii]KAJ9195360.1 hypothetical protein DTO164E3_6896 [Paecilomyces variotii]KAJ9232285.1 hypothetical protein DTO169E5_7587 [Paecilomyces variotii]KAJ9269582.1 hypothetical protein DTO212C5_4433 [Paecilomyces variotii]KAJ9281333.1 hypothetical protein DTO021D3_1992 [Paecilomyces variotii]
MAKSKVPAAQAADAQVADAQVAGAETGTPELIFSSSMFSSPEDLYKHALRILSTVTSHEELIYKHILPAWAQTILDQLDDRFEGTFRKNYNVITSTIWIRIMPTELHDCHQNWINAQKFRWYRTGQITAHEYEYLRVMVGTTIPFIHGPYARSRKEPDLLLRVDGRRLPSLVVESGWSESFPRLEEDMNLWLVGGQGQVKATIILNWRRVRNTDTVRGNVLLYTLDRNNMPRLQQDIVIFPAPPPIQAASEQLILSRKEVFGGEVLQGRNSNDQLVFSIDLLREEARIALGLMGLSPA